jgi:hypothetical protein
MFHFQVSMFKNFFSSSLTLQRNKLEYLPRKVFQASLKFSVSFFKQFKYLQVSKEDIMIVVSTL